MRRNFIVQTCTTSYQRGLDFCCLEASSFVNIRFPGKVVDASMSVPK